MMNLRTCLASALAVLALGGTSRSASPETNGIAASLPFEIRRGHVMIQAQLNDTDAQSFMLDTGYGVTLLPPGQADALSLRRAGRITIVGIAGEEQAGLFEGPEFDFGGLRWKPRRVAAFPTDDSSRRSRHGILGSGFFRKYVVEIDPRTKRVTLRLPENFRYDGDGEVVPLTFKDSTPIVEARFVEASGELIAARLELDLGCDSCLCLGRDFTEKHSLLPSDAPSSGARSGVGGSTKIHHGRTPDLRIGKLTFSKPRANFFLEGSPSEAPLAGHIGYELLRDHRLILDYSRSRLIVERAGRGKGD